MTLGLVAKAQTHCAMLLDNNFRGKQFYKITVNQLLLAC